MTRLLGFVACSFALLTLPSLGIAQKGGGGPGGGPGGGGGKGGGIMMKGGPDGGQGGQGGGQNGKKGGSNQGLDAECTQATVQGISSLKTLVGQLKQNKMNSPAAQAVAADFQKATAVIMANGLSNQQKQQALAGIMQQTLGDLQALAKDGSLTNDQAVAMANFVSQFGQLTETVQRGQQQNGGGGPGGPGGQAGGFGGGKGGPGKGPR